MYTAISLYGVNYAVAVAFHRHNFSPQAYGDIIIFMSSLPPLPHLSKLPFAWLSISAVRISRTEFCHRFIRSSLSDFTTKLRPIFFLFLFQNSPAERLVV